MNATKPVTELVEGDDMIWTGEGFRLVCRVLPHSDRLTRVSWTDGCAYYANDERVRTIDRREAADLIAEARLARTEASR